MARRHAKLRPERTGHVRLIRKAAARGDFLQSQISASQKLLGPIDPFFHNEGVARAIERVPQMPIEGPNAHAKELGHVFERYGVMKLRVNELFQPGELPLRKARRTGWILEFA